VTIGVNADEQCENRCGFVATHFAAVIVERQEIKIVSAEYRHYQKQFHGQIICSSGLPAAASSQQSSQAAAPAAQSRQAAA
jgi:hypothetical protein